MKATGRIDEQNRWFLNCWLLIVKKNLAPPRMGGHNAAVAQLAA